MKWPHKKESREKVDEFDISSTTRLSVPPCGGRKSYVQRRRKGEGRGLRKKRKTRKGKGRRKKVSALATQREGIPRGREMSLGSPSFPLKIPKKKEDAGGGRKREKGWNGDVNRNTRKSEWETRRVQKREERRVDTSPPPLQQSEGTDIKSSPSPTQLCPLCPTHLAGLFMCKKKEEGESLPKSYFLLLGLWEGKEKLIARKGSSSALFSSEREKKFPATTKVRQVLAGEKGAQLLHVPPPPRRRKRRRRLKVAN